MRFGSSLIGAALLAGIVAGPATTQAASPVVTMLGDSITAGYGLAAADALPARLQASVARLGLTVLIRAAGVSGDTAEGGLARVGFSVQPDTELCIVELGANDYLQSVPPDETRRSLDGIIRALKARHIRVLLLGGNVPPRSSGHYASDFDAIFPGLAAAENVTLEPDFLAGVQNDPALHQPDGLHPNARGVRVMADKIAPYVVQALKR